MPDEITSFISWYVWTAISGGVVWIMDTQKSPYLAKLTGMCMFILSGHFDFLVGKFGNKGTSDTKSFRTCIPSNKICHQE